MSEANDILVVVDCINYNVKMYAADANIVVNNTQGSEELYVRVPVGTNLHWRATPLQTSEGIEDEGEWSVIITQVQLWGPNNSTGQGDASKYLINWGNNNGGSDRPCYANQGSLPFHASGSNQLSGDIPVTIRGTNRPFVECTTALTGRDETQSPKVAYTFWCTIYKNSNPVKTINWDPFVQVYRP